MTPPEIVIHVLFGISASFIKSRDWRDEPNDPTSTSPSLGIGKIFDTENDSFKPKLSYKKEPTISSFIFPSDKKAIEILDDNDVEMMKAWLVNYPKNEFPTEKHIRAFAAITGKSTEVLDAWFGHELGSRKQPSMSDQSPVDELDGKTCFQENSSPKKVDPSFDETHGADISSTRGFGISTMPAQLSADELHENKGLSETASKPEVGI